MISDSEMIASNLASVRSKIEQALEASGRPLGAAQLLVVTKGQSVEKIQALIDSGGILLGENYPEETARKIPELTLSSKVNWHMIGHIQSRKIKYLVQYFDQIESVDSLETAKKLESKFAEAGKQIKVMLEVNVSGEQSKQGFDLVSRTQWLAFVEDIRLVMDLPHLELVGLMTMPPLGGDPESSRVYFRSCRELGSFINDTLKLNVISQLSMGTSHDYPVAVEEGATIVRVGEAIMGPRNYA